MPRDSAQAGPALGRRHAARPGPRGHVHALCRPWRRILRRNPPAVEGVLPAYLERGDQDPRRADAWDRRVDAARPHRRRTRPRSRLQIMDRRRAAADQLGRPSAGPTHACAPPARRPCRQGTKPSRRTTPAVSSRANHSTSPTKRYVGCCSSVYWLRPGPNPDPLTLTAEQVLAPDLLLGQLMDVLRGDGETPTRRDGLVDATRAAAVLLAPPLTAPPSTDGEEPLDALARWFKRHKRFHLLGRLAARLPVDDQAGSSQARRGRRSLAGAAPVCTRSGLNWPTWPLPRPQPWPVPWRRPVDWPAKTPTWTLGRLTPIWCWPGWRPCGPRWCAPATRPSSLCAIT